MFTFMKPAASKNLFPFVFLIPSCKTTLNVNLENSLQSADDAFFKYNYICEPPSSSSFKILRSFNCISNQLE